MSVFSCRLVPTRWALLNFYTPADFEQVIMAGGLPAEAFTLPPQGVGMHISQP